MRRLRDHPFWEDAQLLRAGARDLRSWIRGRGHGYPPVPLVTDPDFPRGGLGHVDMVMSDNESEAWFTYRYMNRRAARLEEMARNDLPYYRTL